MAKGANTRKAVALAGAGGKGSGTATGPKCRVRPESLRGEGSQAGVGKASAPHGGRRKPSATQQASTRARRSYASGKRERKRSPIGKKGVRAGGKKPREMDWKSNGTLSLFDQTEFVSPLYVFNTSSLDKNGYLYVPNSCKENECQVHVAIHGCHQGRETLES